MYPTEQFTVTRISVTESYPVLTKKVKVRLITSSTISTEIITDFVEGEGFKVAETPSAITPLKDPRNFAVLVKIDEENYDIWNLLLTMDLTLPMVADGWIAYPDNEALTDDPDCPVPGICTTC